MSAEIGRVNGSWIKLGMCRIGSETSLPPTLCHKTIVSNCLNNHSKRFIEQFHLTYTGNNWGITLSSIDGVILPKLLFEVE